MKAYQWCLCFEMLAGGVQIKMVITSAISFESWTFDQQFAPGKNILACTHSLLKKRQIQVELSQYHLM